MAKKFTDSPENKKMQQKIDAGGNYSVAILGGSFITRGGGKFLNLLPSNVIKNQKKLK